MKPLPRLLHGYNLKNIPKEEPRFVDLFDNEQLLVGGFQPQLKNMFVKLDHFKSFPPIFGVNIKNA